MVPLVDRLAALLAAGADAAALDANGARPLAVAAFCGNTDVTRLLAGAPGAAAGAGGVDHRDGAGATALWLAASGGRREDVKVLLAAGADRHAANSEGVSAHDAASRNGHAECAALLGGA